jgi:hypothetical protein
MTVKNDKKDPFLGFVCFPQPLIDDILCLQQEPSGRWHAQRSGEKIPKGKWPLQDLFPLFPVRLDPGEEKNLLFQVTSIETMQIPLYLANHRGVDHDRRLILMIFGLFSGLMGAMWLVNLLAYWRFQSIENGIYALHIFFWGLLGWMMLGYGHDWLSPHIVVFSNHLTVLLALGVQMSGIEFTKRFLNTKEHIPIVHLFLWSYQIFLTILGLWTASNINLSGVYLVLLSIAFLWPALSLWAAILRLRQGSFSAVFFFLGHILMALFMISYGFLQMSLISFKMFLSYGILLAGMVEAIIQLLALMEKFHRGRQLEKQAQQTLINQLEEDLVRLQAESTPLRETNEPRLDLTTDTPHFLEELGREFWRAHTFQRPLALALVAWKIPQKDHKLEPLTENQTQEHIRILLEKHQEPPHRFFFLEGTLLVYVAPETNPEQLKKLLTTVCSDFVAQGQEPLMRINAGITHRLPTDRTKSFLLNRAEEALFLAKKSLPGTIKCLLEPLEEEEDDGPEIEEAFPS